jgi:hypothetical protein
MNENIKGFITSLGPTIVAHVKEETPEAYHLENAVFLTTTGQADANGNVGMTFAPISFFTPDELQKGITCTLSKANVVVTHELKADLIAAYSKMVGRITIVPAGVLDLSGKLR